MDVTGHWTEGDEAYGYFLSILCSPIVTLLVMARAYWRGEARKVREYGERWNDIPEGAPFFEMEVDSSKTTPELDPAQETHRIPDDHVSTKECEYEMEREAHAGTI